MPAMWSNSWSIFLSSCLMSSRILLLSYLTKPAVEAKVNTATLTPAVKSILAPSFKKTSWRGSWPKAVENRRFAKLQAQQQSLRSSRGVTAASTSDHPTPILPTPWAGGACAWVHCLFQAGARSPVGRSKIYGSSTWGRQLKRNCRRVSGKPLSHSWQRTISQSLMSCCSASCSLAQQA